MLASQEKYKKIVPTGGLEPEPPVEETLKSATPTADAVGAMFETVEYEVRRPRLSGETMPAWEAWPTSEHRSKPYPRTATTTIHSAASSRRVVSNSQTNSAIGGV